MLFNKFDIDIDISNKIFHFLKYAVFPKLDTLRANIIVFLNVLKCRTCSAFLSFVRPHKHVLQVCSASLESPVILEHSVS